MKVILLQHVPKVGRRFDVVNVSDGFAANMLFPKKLAEMATPDKVAALEKRKAAAAAEAELHAAELEGAVRNLDGKRVEITVKANEKGHLYKGITLVDIIEAIRTQHRMFLPKEAFHFAENIKATGDHSINMSAHKAKGVVTIHIQAA